MLARFKRLIGIVVGKPITKLNDALKNVSKSDIGETPTIRNLSFKRKILILIGVLFFASNLILSSLLIFSVDNYNKFVNSSSKLDVYLELNRKLFRSKEFLHRFKSFDAQFEYLSKSAKEVVKESKKPTSDYPDSYQYVFNTSYAPNAYLQYILRAYTEEQDPEHWLELHPINFHWGDWVDLSPALPFVEAYQTLLEKQFDGDKIKLQTMIYRICYDKLADKQEEWIDGFTYSNRLFVWEQLQTIGICSAIFKYYYWPIPERIMYETDSKYFKLPVNTYRSAKSIGLEGLTKVYFGDNSVNDKKVSQFINSYDRSNATKELIQIAEEKHIIKPDEKISLQHRLTPKKEDFERQDFDALFEKYKAIERPTKEETKYLNFLNYSKENINSANKFYFTYPKIEADLSGNLHHYNFPWFKTILSHEERINVVHHVIRSWFKFAEQANVISWFNYGNLIGWYFYSMNLPWDSDVDVQLSIKDLDVMGRHWNNTLVIEDPEYGENSFWFQTNPYYMQQNDNQFIDARYIDARTGIYIDISALWHDQSEKTVNDEAKLEPGDMALRCKHYRWFNYNQLFPLNRTLYEGGQAYIVKDYQQIMKGLYGDHPFKQRDESGYNWQEDLSLWIPDHVCKRDNAPKSEDRFDDNGQLTLFGACNNTEVLDLWKRTRKVVATHQKERKLLERGESTEQLTSNALPSFRFFDYSIYR